MTTARTLKLLGVAVAILVVLALSAGGRSGRMDTSGAGARHISPFTPPVIVPGRCEGGSCVNIMH